MVRPSTRVGRSGNTIDEAVQLRDNVLSIVAHDLRSPLSTIIMAADLIRQTESGERTQHFIQTISKAARQADVLIKDLTDVTRLEAGQLRLELSSAPLAYLISSVCELFEPIAHAADVLLACDTRTIHGIEVQVDHSRFVQILSNLISNAIKFTPAGGRVVVRAEATGRFATVAVTDTGIGIAAEELPHVFQRFWQAQHHHRAGAGLGLAIAKGLVEAHGGEIGVVNDASSGSTFFFTIPLSHPDRE